MVTVFANNQVMVTDQNTNNTVIETDPMPMNGNDRVATVVNMHYIYGSSAQVSFLLQGSNDGQNWVTIGSASDINGTGPQNLTASPEEAVYAFVKYKMTFSISDSGGGAACFDLHSVIDHS